MLFTKTLDFFRDLCNQCSELTQLSGTVLHRHSRHSGFFALGSFSPGKQDRDNKACNITQQTKILWDLLTELNRASSLGSSTDKGNFMGGRRERRQACIHWQPRWITDWDPQSKIREQCGFQKALQIFRSSKYKAVFFLKKEIIFTLIS